MKDRQKIKEWLFKTLESLDKTDFKNGTVYYWELGNGLAIVISYEYSGEKNPKTPYAIRSDYNGLWYSVEVSLRIAHSSFFVDDWYYAGGEAFIGVTKQDQEDGMERLTSWIEQQYEFYKIRVE